MVDVLKRAPSTGILKPQEALSLGLIAGVI